MSAIREALLKAAAKLPPKTPIVRKVDAANNRLRFKLK